ncbi:MAG: sulfite exporter TauE/SafE family protein [Mogibacterium sp.]|nr:sulfite exporter TauE/SafE family protein [Mogibacterium sp.]MBR2540860.1 sulfite exporter TauE/SafE family protein [Mogibacterium sp.]
MVTILKVLAVLGLLLNLFLVIRKSKSILASEDGKEKWDESKKYIPYNTIVGVVANFLDVFGIGSYATTSAGFKLGKSVRDGDIPGTLNVGDTLPICLEAFLFAALAGVDGLTLGVLIVAAVIGALCGAKLVTKLNIQGVRLMMGVGMIILGIIMALRVFAVGPFGLVGDGLKLSAGRLVIAAIVQFILGVLMNIGVGLYAPCMALCCGLGLSVAATLPIVMGSSAMLMAFGSGPQYIKAGRFDLMAVITQMAGGAIGVLIAYFFVKTLDVKILTIIIAVVVLLTGVMFFRDYNNGKPRRRNS